MTAQFREFTLDEAMEIARRNDPGPKVPSVSRVLIAAMEEWRRDHDRLLTSLREMVRLRELSLRNECDPERHELDVVRDARAAIDAARKGGVMDKTTNAPAIGDYVLATKYDDGDPGDHWGLGDYDGERDGRHYIKDSEGRQIRGNGFRRVARVRKDVGAWLLGVAARQLEQSQPGTVNLWTMLTPAAFDLET